MRLTPLDIRKQEFSRGLRGFDAEEVQAFLQMVSEQWEELLDENRRRDEKIRELENKMAHYEKVEEALQEALQTARETARNARENAEERAALLLEQAEAKAQEIKRDAEHERHQIKREAAKLSGRRSEIVTRLRAFLTSELELLARYEGDDPAGFIRLLPGEQERTHELSDRQDEQEAVAGPTVRSGPTEAEARGRAGEFAERHERPRDGGTGHRPGAWPPPEIGPEPEAEAPEPERHVHDWTQPESAEGEAEEEAARSSAEYGEVERFEIQGETGTFRDFEEHQPPSESNEAAHPEPGRGGIDEGDGDEQDIGAGGGWTTQTVVSGPSEHPPGEEDVDESEDRTRTQASSEEIEKIRRILSDLE